MDNQTSPSPYYSDDEITLKELIIKIKEYWLVLWGKKWWVIAAGVLMASFFLIRAVLKKETYPATLSFLINDAEGNRMGGLSSMLGQFGLGGAFQSGRYNLDRVVELTRSQRIISKSLFDSVEIEGKLDLVANHMIRNYDFHQGWKDHVDPLLKEFLFTVEPPEKFNSTATIALRQLVGLITGDEKNKNSLLTINYGEESGIFKLTVKAIHPALSIALAKGIYSSLSDYYISRAIEPQKLTVTTLEQKLDSVKLDLDRAEVSLAAFENRNQFLISELDRYKREGFQRQVSILNILYGEVLKNLETARFALQTNTPVFQAIDSPTLPIKAERPSKRKAVMTGGVLGALLAVSFFLGRKIYLDAMSS